MQIGQIVLRKFTILFLTILFPAVALAQTPDTVFMRQDHHYDDTLIYTTDTIIFESGMRKKILFGTTKLPSTHNQQMARSLGLHLHNVTKSDCRRDAYKGMNADKVHSVIETDSSLTVEINITDNCCYEFLCDISLDTIGTLNLIYLGYGTYCACDCCFGLTFHFAKHISTEIKAVMINEDRNTIKQIKK